MSRPSDRAGLERACLLAVLACLAVTREARAQSTAPAAAPPSASAPDDATTTQAREAFRVGSALARQGQWLEALGSFERSERLKAHPVTLYNVGYCERALGRLTRSRRTLTSALAGALPGAPQLSPELAAAAKGYLVEIEHRLARAVVTVEGAGAALAVDGRPLDTDPASGLRAILVAGTREPGPPERLSTPSFDLLLDPGVHVFVLAARSGLEKVSSTTFAAGSSVLLTLSVGEPPSRAGSAVCSEHGVGVSRTACLVIAVGLGASGVVAGAVAGVAATRQKAELDAQCGDTMKLCPPTFQGGIDALHRDELASTVAFAVGGVGFAAAAILLLTTRGGSSGAVLSSAVGKRRRGLDVSAEVWIDGGALALRGVFP
jgi:hypothetical protein